VDGSTPTEDADKDTPLHSAVQEKSVDHTHIVVNHASDGTTQDPGETTTLDPAVLEGSVGIKRLPAEHEMDATAQSASETTPSHLVVQEESVGRTRSLVEHGANATVQDDEDIPLHSSVQEGSTDPAHIPIEKNEDMTARDKPESAPLHVEHGAQANRDRLHRFIHPFLDAPEMVLVGLLFYWIVTLE